MVFATYCAFRPTAYINKDSVNYLCAGICLANGSFLCAEGGEVCHDLAKSRKPLIRRVKHIARAFRITN